MVRVYMLSQLPLFSQGVETLLCREKDVEIVGRETELERALAQIKQLGPDVVLLDTSLLPDDVATVAARILTAHKDVRVIALSTEDNTVAVFREEQRLVHKIQDLVRAITNGVVVSHSASEHATLEDHKH